MLLLGRPLLQTRNVALNDRVRGRDQLVYAAHGVLSEGHAALLLEDLSVSLTR